MEKRWHHYPTLHSDPPVSLIGDIIYILAENRSVTDGLTLYRGRVSVYCDNELWLDLLVETAKLIRR